MSRHNADYFSFATFRPITNSGSRSAAALLDSNGKSFLNCGKSYLKNLGGERKAQLLLVHLPETE